MDTSPPHDKENPVSDIFEGYTEVKKEVLAIETRKAAYKLFSVAGVLLIFNLIAVIASGIPLSYVLLDILIFPVVFVGLGLLAFKEPMVATILGMVIIFGLWIYNAVVVDMVTLTQGWLGKAIVIYLLFAGMQNAREAHRVKQELKG